MSADAYRFCMTCQTLRLRSEFVPKPGRHRKTDECCTICRDRILARDKQIAEPRERAIA